MDFHEFHKKTQPGIIPAALRTAGRVKKYPRFPQVTLPRVHLPDTGLGATLRNRTSYHHEGLTPHVSLEDLSTLLMAFSDKPTTHEGEPSRLYPSGGNLNVLEVYVFPVDVSGLPTQSYHYRPDLHALETLYDVPEGLVRETVAQTLPSLPSVLIVLTAMWPRAAHKYKELAYRIAHLEAGHAMHNLLLLATALNITARPVVGLRGNVIEEHLDLDSYNESVLYGALVGIAELTNDYDTVHDQPRS